MTVHGVYKFDPVDHHSTFVQAFSSKESAHYQASEWNEYYADDIFAEVDVPTFVVVPIEVYD